MYKFNLMPEKLMKNFFLFLHLAIL